MIKLRTKFDYRIRYSMLHTKPDGSLSVTVNVVPAFEGYNENMDDDCVVMDVAVLESLNTLQGRECCYPLTCECGDPEDAGITEPVLATAEGNELRWQFPVMGYEGVFESKYAEEAEDIICLRFDKHQYSEALASLKASLRQLRKNGVAVDQLSKEDFTRAYHSWDILQKDKRVLSGELKTLAIEGINPDQEDVLALLGEDEFR